MVAFAIETTISEGRCLLALRGEADLAVASDVIERGTGALREQTTRTLIIDLGEVSFMDSTGLAALLQLKNVAADLGKQLRLSRIPGCVHKLLDVTGLERVFVDSSAEPDRCVSYDISSGRCQLMADHDGVHAADMGGGSCITWLAGEVQHWRMHPAPHWLIELHWAPGFQPAVHGGHQIPPSIAV